MGFRRLLHLLKDERRDLRGRMRLAVGLDPGVAVLGLGDLIGNEADVLLGHRIVEGAANQSLDREKCALRVGDALTLRRLAHKPFAFIRERDDRRCRTRASAFSTTFGVEPSMTAMHELVVPRSIPMTLAMCPYSFRVAEPPNPEAVRPMGGRMFARSPMIFRLALARMGARLPVYKRVNRPRKRLAGRLSRGCRTEASRFVPRVPSWP